jgi:PAT family beta-lactamase induction signal transducer AmpG
MAKARTSWAWVPTLYFAEGLPYVLVVTVSAIMFKQLGISNADVALYTSWLYLPWVIKPFWSPFVDLVKTKRWWLLLTQIILGAGQGGRGWAKRVTGCCREVRDAGSRSARSVTSK